MKDPARVVGNIGHVVSEFCRHLMGICHEMSERRHKGGWIVRRLRYRSPVLTVLVVLSCAGCGGGPATDYSSLELLEVRGRVQLDDRPLSGATVTFESPDTSYSYAVTDQDGRYRLRLNSERTGVTPGAKLVRITTRPTAENPQGGWEELEEAPADRAAAVDRVPPRYNQQTELRVEVTESVRDMDFDLVSTQLPAR